MQPRRKPDILGGATGREAGGGLRRFNGFAPHADLQGASLAAGNAALTEGRTIFTSTVIDADKAPRVLVSGVNSPKIGATVRKGPWRRLPIYTLTLEERATCPRSCYLWRACYGSAMPKARRHRHGPPLIAALDLELKQKAVEHRRGFVVRLHVLGDFYSVEYARCWLTWMMAYPRMRVFGYTAHPRDSEIGEQLAVGNRLWPDRWAIRFSVHPDQPIEPMQATTVWRQVEGPHAPEGLICPAQTGATDACATCGLCWAPAAADKRIAFIGHGKTHRRKARPE